MMAFFKSLTSLLLLWAKQATASLPCTITWDTTTPPEYYIIKDVGGNINLSNWGYSSYTCSSGWLLHSFTYDSTTQGYMTPLWITMTESTLASS